MEKCMLVATMLMLLGAARLIQNRRDKLKVLTVAFVDGGQAGNVIPESVRFAGTFRFMTLEGYSYLKQRIKEKCLLLSTDRSLRLNQEYMSYSATVDFMEEMRPYPPTINDSTIYDHNQRVGEILFGNTFPSFDGCRGLGVLLATAFFFIGTQNKTISSSVKGLHSLYFTIDEEVLPIGAALHAAFAISYLDTHFKSRVTQ
ncbi:IAA-amino acid hydrolase ILR1-like 7 [Solanum tuberosum]|uniref:IAA-amino acid hydrolase ILR1-like 7 n=1 Tax=Solanum tuberosum TaxID=4113 RepID=UPI00073A519D|nr:PREDICTED: IAA-amino acid hydrolase ILR1-like 7 [Solanum tuberosum]